MSRTIEINCFGNLAPLNPSWVQNSRITTSLPQPLHESDVTDGLSDGCFCTFIYVVGGGFLFLLSLSLSLTCVCGMQSSQDRNPSGVTQGDWAPLKDAVGSPRDLVHWHLHLAHLLRAEPSVVSTIPDKSTEPVTIYVVPDRKRGGEGGWMWIFSWHFLLIPTESERLKLLRDASAAHQMVKTHLMRGGPPPEEEEVNNPTDDQQDLEEFIEHGLDIGTPGEPVFASFPQVALNLASKQQDRGRLCQTTKRAAFKTFRDSAHRIYHESMMLQSQRLPTGAALQRMTQRQLGQAMLLSLNQGVLRSFESKESTPSGSDRDTRWGCFSLDSFINTAVLYSFHQVRHQELRDDLLSHPAGLLTVFSVSMALSRMAHLADRDPALVSTNPAWGRAGTWVERKTIELRVGVPARPTDGFLARLGPRTEVQQGDTEATIHYVHTRYRVPNWRSVHVVEGDRIRYLMPPFASHILVPTANRLGVPPLQVVPRPASERAQAAEPVSWDARNAARRVGGEAEMKRGDAWASDDDDEEEEERMASHLLMDMELEEDISDEDRVRMESNVTCERALQSLSDAVRREAESDPHEAGPGVVITDSGLPMPTVAELRKRLPGMVCRSVFQLIFKRQAQFGRMLREHPEHYVHPVMCARTLAELSYLTGNESTESINCKTVLTEYVRQMHQKEGCIAMAPCPMVTPGVSLWAGLRCLTTEMGLHGDPRDKVCYNGHSQSLMGLVACCMLGTIPVNGLNMVFMGVPSKGKSFRLAFMARNMLVYPVTISTVDESKKSKVHSAQTSDGLEVCDDKSCKWVQGIGGDNEDQIAKLKIRLSQPVANYDYAAVKESEHQGKKGSRITSLSKEVKINYTLTTITNVLDPSNMPEALQNRHVVHHAISFDQGEFVTTDPRRTVQRLHVKGSAYLQRSVFQTLHVVATAINYMSTMYQTYQDAQSIERVVKPALKAIYDEYPDMREHLNARAGNRIANELHTQSIMRYVLLHYGDRVLGRCSASRAFPAPAPVAVNPQHDQQLLALQRKLYPGVLWQAFTDAPPPVDLRVWYRAGLITREDGVLPAQAWEAQAAVTASMCSPLSRMDDEEEEEEEWDAQDRALLEDFERRMTIHPPAARPLSRVPHIREDILIAMHATPSAGDAVHTVTQAVRHMGLFADSSILDTIMPWIRNHMKLSAEERKLATPQKVIEYFMPCSKSLWCVQGHGTLPPEALDEEKGWGVAPQFMLIPITGGTITARTPPASSRVSHDAVIDFKLQDEGPDADEMEAAAELLGIPAWGMQRSRSDSRVAPGSRGERLTTSASAPPPSLSRQTSAAGPSLPALTASAIPWLNPEVDSRLGHSQSGALRRACRVMADSSVVNADEQEIFAALEPLLETRVALRGPDGEEAETLGNRPALSVCISGGTPTYLIVDHRQLKAGKAGRSPRRAAELMLKAWNAPNGTYAQFGNVQPRGEVPTPLKWTKFDPKARVEVHDPSTTHTHRLPGSMDAWCAYFRLRDVLKTTNQQLIEQGFPPLWEPLQMWWAQWVRDRYWAPRVLKSHSVRNDCVHAMRRQLLTLESMDPAGNWHRPAAQLITTVLQGIQTRLPEREHDKKVLAAVLGQNVRQLGLPAWQSLRMTGAVQQRDAEDTRPSRVGPEVAKWERRVKHTRSSMKRMVKDTNLVIALNEEAVFDMKKKIRRWTQKEAGKQARPAREPAGEDLEVEEVEVYSDDD